jgi:hypothetical protein
MSFILDVSVLDKTLAKSLKSVFIPLKHIETNEHHIRQNLFNRSALYR